MPLVVVVAGIVAYLDSFRGVFLFDDMKSIVDNAAIRSFAAASHNLAGAERPVVLLTFALNYAWSRLDVWSYHAVNMANHVLAGLALYAVVEATFASERLRGVPRASARAIACVVALLWVVHPLQTESVTYIVQRGESLMGLFYLLTLYAVVRGARAPRHAAAWYGGAVVACALGMGSKAIMITAPVVVLAYDRIFLSRSWAELWKRRWPLYAGLAASWLVLGATNLAGEILNPEQRAGLTVGLGYRGSRPLQYALTQPAIILHYLRLAFWPQPLCLDYFWPIATSASEIALPLVVVLALVAATVVALYKRPALGFLGTWFFLILAPTSSFVPVQDPAFEHRMYLPLAAVIVAAVAGVRALLGRVVESRATRTAVAAVVTVVVAVACMAATRARNHDYDSMFAMWGSVLRVRPQNPRAHSDYGKALAERGQMADAVSHLETSIRLMPAYYPAHNNLGNALASQGKMDDAIAQFREAIRLKDDFADAHSNLGAALAQTGRLAEAAPELRRALEIDPNNAVAKRNLALVLEDAARRGIAIPGAPATGGR